MTTITPDSSKELEMLTTGTNQTDCGYCIRRRMASRKLLWCKRHDRKSSITRETYYSKAHVDTAIRAHDVRIKAQLLEAVGLDEAEMLKAGNHRTYKNWRNVHTNAERARLREAINRIYGELK